MSSIRYKALRLKRIGIVVMLSFIYMSVGYFIFDLSNNLTEERNKTNMRHLLKKYESEILIKVNEYLTLSKVYKYMLFKNDSFISKNDFTSISKNLIEKNKVIKSLQLAPNGTVTYAYPEKGNENVYIDLFADKKRRGDAIYARDNRVSIMSEPLELFQGGIGLIIRTPIFVGKDFNTFWGFSIVILKVNDFLNTLSLPELCDGGYNYKLSVIQKNSNNKIVISESSSDDLVNAVEHEFSVLNQNWLISVGSPGKWINELEYTYKTYILVFFVIALSLITYMFYRLLIKKEKMYELSYIDSLTGLYNRRAFDKDAKKSFKSSILFFCDLNGFKKINDIYGHEVGDQLLIEVSKRMRSFIDSKGTIYRLGGDEFSILLNKNENVDVHVFINELFEMISESLSISDVVINIGISTGYSVYPVDGLILEDLIRIADKRMYQAKFQYKNRNKA
ncbi:sensor domain-containing diguanylate cyclase [Aliivibrio fischeri]|uniref:sensor domain-containing diguanylate cyclase n=1 Tax=Aliivibrio fischeri TaxID=668 RepID=UPI000A67069F|nr:sensor domain-containing diguanylate cyclase [Aliivibrio fischeri]